MIADDKKYKSIDSLNLLSTSSFIRFTLFNQKISWVVQPVGTEVKVELVISIDQLKKIEADNVLIRVNAAVIRTDEKSMAVCFEKKYKITALKS